MSRPCVKEEDGSSPKVTKGRELVNRKKEEKLQRKQKGEEKVEEGRKGDTLLDIFSFSLFHFSFSSIDF